MAQRPKIAALPEDIRAELEKRLVAGGFSGYEGLAAWLAEQGFEISKSAVHRYGKKFEERLAAMKIATDQARAIAEASADDAGDMNEALIRLVQTKTFEVLLELEDEDNRDLAKIGRMVADLARASVSQKKWADQVKSRVAAKLDTLQASAKQSGLTPELADTIRREILGVL